MKSLLPLLLAASLVSCPTPKPPPPPIPSPTPSPAPLPAGVLLAHDGQFWRDGQAIRLQGVGGVCCTEATADSPNLAKEFGWPLATTEVVKQIAAAKGNFIAIRLGPYIRASEGAGYSGYAETPDGRYNLDVFDAAYWARVRAIVETAVPLGVYVEADLWDGWMQRNAEQVSPLVAARNVQGESLIGCDVLRGAPPARIIAWVQKAVLELGSYPNVTFLLGNENFACGVQPLYEAGLIEAVRYVEGINHYPRHLIGTNAQRADMEAAADYAERHASEAQDFDSRTPVMVNELDSDSLTPEQFAVEMGAAVRRGTAFHLWLGQQTREEWARSLAYIKSSMEGHDKAIPASCPPLAVWKVKIHGYLTPNFQASDAPELGGYATLDSTPFFAGPNGTGPCNGEHDNCGGRKCEPRGGPDWIQVEGAHVPQHLESDGFLLRVGPLVQGVYKFKTCAKADATDQEVPPLILDLSGSGCGTVQWEVR